MKIMLADDELSIGKIVEHVVTKREDEFIYARNGKEAVDMFLKEKPDLVILDIMMPFLDGFDVCGIIRQTSDVPIIILSAKGDIVDKSIGFKLGADDYLVKPFSPVELGLRIDALFRRGSYLSENKNINSSSECFFYKDLKIDYEHLEMFVNNEKVFLTLKEFSIVALLARNQGQTITRSQIIDKVWGDDYVGDESNLTVFIRKIREKIEKDPANPEYIETVWGIGYRFAK